MKSSDPSVAIFWDYENCPVPAGASGYAIANNIYTLVRPYGSVKLFRAYLQINEQMSCSKFLALRSELQASGVSLVDCPHNGRKDVADKMMLVDLLAYAIDVAPPSTIVLITGDRDFAYGLSVLRLRRYRVVLITLPRAHASLTFQASICFDWSKHITTASSNQAGPSTQNPVPQPSDFTSAPLWLQPTFTNGHESQTAETEVGDPVCLGNQTRRELSFSQNSFINHGSRTVDTSSSKQHNPSFPTPITNDNCPTAPLPVYERTGSTGLRSQGTSTESNCCHLTSNHHAVIASSPLMEESPVFPPQTLDDNDIDTQPGSSPGGIGSDDTGTCSVPMCGPAFRATDTVYELAVPTVADETIEPDPLVDVLLPSPLISSSSELESSSGTIRGLGAISPEFSSRSSIPPTRSEPLASPPHRSISAIDKPGHPIRRVFLPLLNELESLRKKGQHRPLRSVVGFELGKQHNVYQKAGVKSFREYVAMAEREGIVTAGGTGGYAWVSFKPQWSDVYPIT